MKRLTPEEFFDSPNCPVAAMPEEWECLYKLMQAYADHCEESAWIDANERLPERWEDYPLSRNCLLFNGKEYLMGFYSYAHSQWESDEYAPIERITHWRPLPAPPQKIPANAPQTKKEKEN